MATTCNEHSIIFTPEGCDAPVGVPYTSVIAVLKALQDQEFLAEFYQGLGGKSVVEAAGLLADVVETIGYRWA